MNVSPFGKGLFFACAAFLLWGILPLYWRLLIGVHPLHILSLRILLSLVLVGALLLARRNVAWLLVFRNPKKAALLVLTGLLLCLNWGLYIWAVNRERTIEASLGYYINPLVSILLGLLFFRERLRPMQWIALAVAFSGVLLITVLSGLLPWVSLALAGTFGFYGLLKKMHSLSALESLGAETLASVPVGIAILLLGFGAGNGNAAFGDLPGLGYFADMPVHVFALLALSGALTALPLYFFAKGTKQLPLSTVGFAQFIAPTLQFLIGLLVFGEDFPSYYLAAFVMIWAAVVLYVVSLRGKR